MEFPELETANLILTKLVTEDANSIFDLFSNERVVKYYDLEAFTELSQATDLIGFYESRYNKQTGIRWAIRLKQTNKLVGTCGFNSWNIRMKSGVIGYDLMPSFWRKGITLEAVNRIVEAAFFGELCCGKLNRIQADTIPENIASESLLLKLGFKEEGLRRESAYWKNQFHDLKCFGLIKSEYSPTKTTI